MSQTLTFESYQKLAERTADPHRFGTERIHVAALGLASEAGEVAGTIKKAAERHQEIDGVYWNRVREEIGDCIWYLAELCTAIDMELADAALSNLRKLGMRYPDGFTPEGSVARRDKSPYAITPTEHLLREDTP